jgi:hypothetical protein
MNTSFQNQNTGANANPSNHQYLRIGASTHAIDQFLNGNMAEVLVYTEVLNDAQRLIIENYLSSKYNLAVATDLYAYEGSGHRYELAGIGQLAGGNNADAQGSSIVRINNASSLDNGDFLLWAHDNTSTNAIDTDVPAAYGTAFGRRLERTWRATRTGDVGTVTVSIDLTGILFGNPASYELLIDADGNFSSGATSHTAGYSLDPVTNIATWTGVTIPDGHYFTVGNPEGIISVTSGLWGTPATWNCNCVPPASSSPIVNTTHTVDIDIVTEVRELFVRTGGILTSNFPASNLSVTEYINNVGTINGNVGTITLSGATTTSVDNTGTLNFGNLTVNGIGGGIINSPGIGITGTLSVIEGTLNAGTDRLTLISTATQTARVGTTGANGFYTGRIIFQRFITGNDPNYADLASPVQSSTFADWAGELLLHFANNQSASAYTYSEPLDDWAPVATSSKALIPGEGYEIYLTDNFQFTSFSNTTLDTRGLPNTGNQILDARVSFTPGNSGSNLVGNPFHSVIAWDAVFNSSSNIINAYDIYDRNTYAYETFGAGSEIPTNSGFWVYTTNSNPTFRIPESAKTTTTNSSIRSMGERLPYMVVQLSTVEKGQTFAHKFRVGHFYEATNEFDVMDKPFRKSPHTKAPSITAFTQGREVNMYSFNSSENMYTIPLKTKVGVNGKYTITFDHLDLFDEYAYIALEDKATGMLYDIRLLDFGYEATLQSTDNENRFVLHFNKQGTATNAASISSMEEQINITRINREHTVHFSFDNDKQVRISVTNLMGQEIMPTAVTRVSYGAHTFRLPESFNGVYFVNVIDGERIVSKKMVINGDY